jgi:hypothetical protein
MQNTGSFGSAIGGMSPELQAAISRRAGGNPSGPMGQTSASAPTTDPTIQQSPMSGQMSVPSMPQGTTGMGMPANSPESQIIIKALDSRLKSLSKIQENGGQIA